jgi:prophage regulatory protein
VKKDIRVMPLSEVIETTTISRSTLFRMVEEGSFPAPRQIGKRRVGWLSDEVQAWLLDRPVAMVKK